MDMYSVINGKKYRKGYTTGSCAAAAAKAAVDMLFGGYTLEDVEIDTPAGIILKLPVGDTILNEGSAFCSVLKDGGDDPDVTTGLKIFAHAAVRDEEGIGIEAGEGIGTATLPGLKVQVGQPAINPVPMSMIHKEVQKVLPPGKGVNITLSVPGGEEAAQRTYNPKLGIVGGISILGTTGIVEPMSEDAWKEALTLELRVMFAKGLKEGIFVFGNYGEEFAVGKLQVKRTHIIKISNFVGYMLDQAADLGFKRIILVGHLGKLVKVAAGIFNTHSRVADARMEVLAAYSALEGAGREALERIYQCRTTDAAAQVIEEYGLWKVYDRIVRSASQRCREYTFDKIEVGSVLFKGIDRIVTMDETAKAFFEESGGRE